MSALGEKGARYTQQQREAAIAIAQSEGIPAAAKALGADQESIRNWLRAKDIDPASLATRNTEQQRRAAEASVVSRRAQMEASKERLTRFLISIAELAAVKEIEYLKGERVRNKTQIDKDGKVTILTDFESVRLSEVVGSRTRAIHDLQLLTGEATVREETLTRDEIRLRAAELDEVAAQRAKRKAAS